MKSWFSRLGSWQADQAMFFSTATRNPIAIIAHDQLFCFSVAEPVHGAKQLNGSNCLNRATRLLEGDGFNPLDFLNGECELFGLKVLFHMLSARGPR